jgi:hypothetical protein
MEKQGKWLGRVSVNVRAQHPVYKKQEYSVK